MYFIVTWLLLDSEAPNVRMKLGVCGDVEWDGVKEGPSVLGESVEVSLHLRVPPSAELRWTGRDSFLLCYVCHL